jgi:tripartite-type tricarboxylate transporter receptor subunit TctC
VNTSAQAYTAVLVKNLPYDPLKDFTAVAPLTSQPYVLVSGTSTGITTARELIAAAKAKPGKLKFGSTGIGTGSHLGLEEFILQAGITAVHVPPQPGDAIADVIANAVAGSTTYMMAPISLALADIRAGKLRAGRDHTEALALTAGRSDHRGGWRPWLRLRDLVWSMGACWHACPSGGQTSEGHRTRTGGA